MSRERARRPTTGAGWVVFAIATAVLLAVLGAILSEVLATSSPPAPVAEVGRAIERRGRFVVPVTLANEGDGTAQDVQVTASLTIDGAERTSDQVVDFLAGGEDLRLEFVFEEDPADGELSVEVGSYRLP